MVRIPKPKAPLRGIEIPPKEWRKLTKNCNLCGKTYSPNPNMQWAVWNTRMYCGKRCASLARERKPLERVQLQCKTEGCERMVEANPGNWKHMSNPRCYEHARRTGSNGYLSSRGVQKFKPAYLE